MKITETFLIQQKDQLNCFRETLDELVYIEETVENIKKAIQKVAWQAAPDRNEHDFKEEHTKIEKQKIAGKRKASKRWQLTRVPQDKERYNKLAKELKNLLHNLKYEGIQDYPKGLTPTEGTDYSLWRTTCYMKRPQHHIPPLRINQNTRARTEKGSHDLFRTPHRSSNPFRPNSR